MGKLKTIEIDGRTGEGGGQLVRVAVALAAVTSQPVKVIHVRGNRPSRSGGKVGGSCFPTSPFTPSWGKTLPQKATQSRVLSLRLPSGLKAQHVTAIRWLAEATEADVEGLEVGSSTLVFTPRIPPAGALDGKSRWIKIAADTGAASTLLILQAILPFLLYAADGEDEPAPVELEVTGGTNVGMSLSYEYLDQVLLPRLQDVFGIAIERNLKKRGWSLGPQSRGSICLTIHPIKRGQRLQPLVPSPEHDFEIRHVDVSMIVPSHMHSDLQNALAKDITAHVPTAEVTFKIVEDSGHDARIYVLLVARSATGLRWGRDILMSTPKKGKQKESVASLVSRRVVRDLAKELSVKGSVCDEFLQDQLVIFQALAEGRTSFPRSPVAEGADVETLQQNVAELGVEERMRRDRTEKPFGQGSMHSQTARWVASEILPGLKWYNKGEICEGVGTSFS